MFLKNTNNTKGKNGLLRKKKLKKKKRSMWPAPFGHACSGVQRTSSRNIGTT